MAMISFLVGMLSCCRRHARWGIVTAWLVVGFTPGVLFSQEGREKSLALRIWDAEWSVVGTEEESGMSLSDWQKALQTALITKPPERVLGIPARHHLSKLNGKWNKAVESGNPVPFGAASIFDEISLEQTKILFRSRMVRMGCLDATVAIDTRIDTPKVNLVIELDPGLRLKCGSVSVTSEGSGLPDSELTQITQDWKGWEGQWLDLDALDRMRTSSASALQSRGWYGFMSEHLTLDVDTTGSRSTGLVALQLHVLPKDLSGTMAPHKKATVNQVRVEWRPIEMTTMEERVVNGVQWRVPTGRDLRPLQHQLQLKPGETFDPQKIASSRQAFRSLSLMRQVTLEIEPVVDTLTLKKTPLGVTIGLEPVPKRFMRVNGALTSRFAIGGEVLLALGNLDFRQRAEKLTLDLQAGIQRVPYVFVETDEAFNSRVLSATAQYSAMRLIPFGPDRFSRSNRPESRISLTYRDEVRPEFGRTFIQLGLVERFIENQGTGSKLEIRAFEAALTSSRLEPEFENELNLLQSGILTSSFLPRALFASGISWWLSPSRKPLRPSFRLHLEVESAGALFHALDPRSPVNTVIQTPSFFGPSESINVARYTRWVFDLKNDWQFRKRTGLHSRCYFGIVASSIEDQSAPLEKQFFVGGPNSMRGWSALRLGPGASTNENLNVRGDMKIELNLEARHYLNDWIQVATFVDAGNVWMTREEENRPNVHFERDRFLSEMAVSVGGGVRLDFGYFMLRCDAGIPIRQPGKQEPTANGWRIHPAVSLPF